MKGFSFMTGQCKFDGDLFCFFPRKKTGKKPLPLAKLLNLSFN